jgi:hypothetical protein
MNTGHGYWSKTSQTLCWRLAALKDWLTTALWELPTVEQVMQTDTDIGSEAWALFIYHCDSPVSIRYIQDDIEGDFPGSLVLYVPGKYTTILEVTAPDELFSKILVQATGMGLRLLASCRIL